MKWIMDGIANVILEALNDILIFSINLVTGFKLEVWDETSDFGLIFGSIVKGFMSSILVLSMFLVIMCSILKLYQAMGGPFTQSEEPGVIAVRTIFAGLGTVFAYDTFEFMTKAFNGVYTLFVNVYTGAAADYMSGSWIPSTEDAESARESVSNATPANPRVDIDLRPNSATEAIRNAADNSVFNFFGGDHLINGSTDPSIGLVILEAVIGCALIICFFKLVVEVYIRYILIGVMYITAPLAFSTLISKTSNIFKNWCHMIVSQYILMCFNLLFLGTFVGAWYKILEQAQTNGYVFTDAKQYLTTMFLLIGWLITGQSMDEHLRALGLSAATTGSGIMGAMMGGAAIAQDEQKKDNDKRMPNKTEMIQRRTDMMVNRYGLNDKQKEKLQKLNTEYADKLGGPGMGMRRGGHGGHGMGHGMRPGQRPEAGGNAPSREGKRPEMSEEQRAQMKQQMEQMRKNREAYGAELKKIMTEEQYKKFQDDEQQNRGRGGMRGGMRGPRGGQPQNQ